MAGLFFEKASGARISWTMPLDIAVYTQNEGVKENVAKYLYSPLANMSYIQSGYRRPDVSRIFSDHMRRIREGEPTREQLRSRFNPERLSLNLFGYNPERYQTIVLFTGGIEEALEYAGRDLLAGIVLIYEADRKAFESIKTKWEPLEQIADHANAAGVFALSGIKAGFLGGWLDKLLRGLVGNEHFLQIFDQTASNHISLIDPEANWNTPVSQALDNILERLDRHPYWMFSEYPTYKLKNPDKVYRNIYGRLKNIRDSFHFKFGHDELFDALQNALEPLQQFEQSEGFQPDGYRGDDSYTTEMRRPSAYYGDGDEGSAEYDDDGNEPTYEPDAESILQPGQTQRRGDEPAPQEEKSRILQAGIFQETGDAAITDHLRPDTAYLARVNIGPPEQGFLRGGLIPEDIIFADPASQEEQIDIHFIAEGHTPQKSTLLLPRQGKSNELAFPFRTHSASDNFSCDIIAVHKNRVIQWIALRAVVTDATGGGLIIKANPVICTRSQLDNLADRATFSGLLIVGDEDSDGHIKVSFQNQPISLYSNDGIKDRMDIIKGKIQSASLNKQDFPNELANPNMVNLLRELAIHGEQLFGGFAGDTDIAGPVQIIAYRKDFVPANFVYNLPPPADDAPLCEHAVEALNSGKCLDCFDKKSNSGTHICPFGFWGLSKVIEYHSVDRAAGQAGNGDFVFQSEPSAGREILHILDNVIHGSSRRVDALTPGTRESIKRSISSCATLHYASDWTQWVNLTTAHKPDSIFLIVHTEKDQYQISRMEIEADFLSQNRLTEQHVFKPRRPLAVVIGCSTSNITDQGFDIGNEFIRKGAAIVISNFSKILSNDAAMIVGDLIDLLKAEKGKTVRFGEVVLRLKQRMLAKGVLVGMSLVTYGDADWQITLDKEPAQAHTSMQ